MEHGEPFGGVEFRIAPSEPSLHRNLTRMIIESEFKPNSILARARGSLGNPDLPTGFRFLCSLLIDLDAWGAVFEIDQSQLMVMIPSLSNALSDRGDLLKMRAALERLRGSDNRFVPSISQDEAAIAALHGQFSLEPVGSESTFLSEAFRSGVTTWSMPYRAREGRSKRFVLVVEYSGRRFPAGILEIGDDAPRNPPRDRLMGLLSDIAKFDNSDIMSLRMRFESIRKSLLADGLPRNFQDPPEVLASSLEQILQTGRGRTGTSAEIAEKKRLTYLGRLIKAELACLGVEGGSFGEGLRVLRDLSIPRTNVELTVCGALPPFGNLLVGKLVASMACHPDVRSFVDRDFGLITRGLFDVGVLDDLLPRHGALVVTTRGLYPAHSAQYNKVACPGENGRSVPLRKLGDTEGQTASHISDASVRLAVELNNAMGGMEVSRVFGAGGAKRQRIITEALRKVGLPVGLSHASVSRPVYGVSLARNLERVIVFNEQPEWIAEPYAQDLDSGKYLENAVSHWRDRWSQQIARRAGNASIE